MNCFIKSAIGFYLLCLAFSCKTSTQTDIVENTSVDTVAYALVVHQKSYPKVIDGVQTTCNIEYHIPDSAADPILYDFYQKEVIQKVLTDNIGDSAIIYKSADELMDNFLKSYQEELELNKGYLMTWDLSKYAYILYNRNRILSVNIGENGFMGGAHGYKYNQYASFDLNTKKKIKLEDAFIGDYKRLLELVGEKYFREEQSIPDSVSLVDAGYFEKTFVETPSGKFAINDNFYFDNEGIVFYYNDYEIACYAVGPSMVRIPYAEMKTNIKKDGPLKGFIQ